MIQAVYISHQGNTREKNEDNICFNRKYLPLNHQFNCSKSVKEIDNVPAIFAVFDGIGGECYGEVASFISARELSNWDKGIKSRKSITTLVNYLNECVYKESDRLKAKTMGTTFSMVLLYKKTVWISNLGDTHIYLYRDNRLTLLSEEHTDKEILKVLKINSKPRLTQYLGINSKSGFVLEPYIINKRIRKNDIFIICSDGLTDEVTDKELEIIIEKNQSIDLIQKELLTLVLSRKGNDNISMIICKVQ